MNMNTKYYVLGTVSGVNGDIVGLSKTFYETRRQHLIEDIFGIEDMHMGRRHIIRKRLPKHWGRWVEVQGSCPQPLGTLVDLQTCTTTNFTKHCARRYKHEGTCPRALCTLAKLQTNTNVCFAKHCARRCQTNGTCPQTLCTLAFFNYAHKPNSQNTVHADT